MPLQAQMKTEKLFYENAFIRSCAAAVTGCCRVNDHYGIVLDRTCFYPEGGGQPGDTGRLDQTAVFDTQEKDGVILHYTREPLEPGVSVTAEIDWNRRFDYMQQHSGEHMISGLVHQRFGYDNVGFHMGAERTTIDFSGELTLEELREIGEDVNRKIWQNEPVRIWFPEPGELEKLSYRSKKELTGDVRIVEFPGADRCACCGTHVERTGEIGLVLIQSAERFHGGSRVEILCGERAARYLGAVHEQNRQISRLLSAEPLATAKAAEEMAEDLNQKRIRIFELEEEMFRMKAEESAGKGNVLVFLKDLNPDAVRRACDTIQKTCGGRCAVFSGTEEEGYKYAVGLPDGDLREFVRTMNGALNGRGGGKPFFVQGSVKAKRSEISLFFDEN